MALRSNSGLVNLSFSLMGDSRNTFSRQFSTNHLSLFRIEQYNELERTLVRRLSSIKAGTLYFESLNGRSLPLRSGQALDIEVVQGFIRTLELLDDGISLSFHGYVKQIKSGYGEHPRNLMPTYLEWLHARHGLSLLWGSTLYLFGLVVGALRWWGISI
jgi:hypothetical protein